MAYSFSVLGGFAIIDGYVLYLDALVDGELVSPTIAEQLLTGSRNEHDWFRLAEASVGVVLILVVVFTTRYRRPPSASRSVK